MGSGIQHVARAFVRKYPATKKRPFPQTVVLLIVAGDVEGLTDEALHDCKVIDLAFMGAAITLDVIDREVQERLLGWETGDILSDGMSGPLR
jgi:hypothetical protein